MGAKVFNRSRADRVNAKLRAFLDWWEKNGTFDITIPKDGTVRTQAEQEALYAQGRTKPGKIITNASNVLTTAHGRGGALDVYPVRTSALGLVLRIYTGDESDPADRAEAMKRFRLFGEAAERFGLTWGGRWKSPVDSPHIEVTDWKSLPAPIA